MNLNDIAAQVGDGSIPPVHLWHPEHCGKIDIRIDRNGHWYHEGEEIKRPALVRLFASVLWFENGCYYLKTPVEQMEIKVELEPVLIVDAEQKDDNWYFETQFGEVLLLSDTHPMGIRAVGTEIFPRIRVRYDLWGMLERNLYYRLVDCADKVEDRQNRLVELILKSDQKTWVLGSYMEED